MQTGDLNIIGSPPGQEITIQMLDGGAHMMGGICAYSFKEECVWLWCDPMGTSEIHIFPLMNVERVVIGAWQGEPERVPEHRAQEEVAKKEVEVPF